MNVTVFLSCSAFGINPLQLIEKLEDVWMAVAGATVRIESAVVVEAVVTGRFDAVFCISKFNDMPGYGLSVNPKDLKQAVIQLASKGGQVIRDLANKPELGVQFHISCW